MLEGVGWVFRLGLSLGLTHTNTLTCREILAWTWAEHRKDVGEEEVGEEASTKPEP
jgi:hypothetical protein